MRDRKHIERERIPVSDVCLKGVDRYELDIKGVKKLLQLSLEILLDIRDLLLLERRKSK